MKKNLLEFLIVCMGVVVGQVVFADVLPELTICSGHDYTIQSGSERPYGGNQDNWGWMSYSCQEKCPGNFMDCIYPCPENGIPFLCVAFVVDGMGGVVRYTEDRGEPGPTVLIHEPGSGTRWDFTWIARRLMQDGVKVAQVKWERGGFLIISALHVPFWGGAGWFTRPDSKPTTIQALSRRPGAVIKWVHDNLAPHGKKYGTIGCSGGSLATSSAMYWHRVDEKTRLIDIVDYQYLTGLVPYYDFGDFCTRSHDNPGICENDPCRNCISDADCGGGLNRCAFLDVSWITSAVVPIPDLIDYIHMSKPDERCLDGKVPLGVENSSMKYTQGFRDLGRTRLDFVVGEGSSSLWFLGDTFMGLTAGAAYVYREFRGGRESWYDYEGYYHCASLIQPELIPEAIQLIEKGLGMKK